MAEILILSLILSIDALSFGITFGIRGIKIPLKAFFTLSVIGLGAIALSIGAGNLLKDIIPYCNIAGALLLIGIGIWICADKKKEDMNIHEMLENPELSDINRSGVIETPEAIVIGITLSLDSSAAAVSTSMAGISCCVLPLSVMTAQLIFLLLGIALGKKIRPDINCKYIAVISGLAVVLIGLYRLKPIFC